jgi:hypothetical protein
MYNQMEVMDYEDIVPAIKQDMDYLYRQCKNTIDCKSYLAKRAFMSVDVDDIKLKSEEIFVECYYKYSREFNAKFSTYFSNVLGKKLNKWCRRQVQLQNRVKEINSLDVYLYGISVGTGEARCISDEIDISITEEKTFENSFGYFIENLSEESKDIVKTAYLNQTEIIESNPKKHKTRVNKCNLMSYLETEKQTPKKVILNSYAEIKQALGEFNGYK